MVQQLAELRQAIEARLDVIACEVRVLRQQRRDAGELPAAILACLVAIERAVGLVEVPAAPRIKWRRPLE